MADNTEIWVKTGYQVFANNGMSEMKIEKLAKKVGISKSSFYHHFADLEVFMTFLLEYHLQQSYIIAAKEKNAQNIDPELINILVEHKTDLLFNRQLRIHRNQELFAETLLKTDQIVGNNFVMVWVKDLDLRLNPSQLEGLFRLALENFYLQINATNLNYTWLAAYFKELKKIAATFA